MFATTSAALLLLQQLTNGQTLLNCYDNSQVSTKYDGVNPVHLMATMPHSGDLELDCGASTFTISMIRIFDDNGGSIRDYERTSAVTFSQDLTHSQEVNYYVSGSEVAGDLGCTLTCHLDCPMATTEVEGYFNDFDSNIGYSFEATIQDCRNACDANSGCVTFSWNAADDGCTLYDSDSPTKYSSTQILCQPDGAPECNVGCSGGYATLSGDPHSTLWNGAYHHFQGQTHADDNSPQQFYFMTPCDHDDRHYMPYSILGKFQAWTHNGNLAGLDYVTLMLYDEYDTYYVWFSTGIRRWIKADAGVSTLYDENVANGIAMTQINAGDIYVANGKFKITTTGNEGENDAYLTLTTVDTGCSQQIYMQYQSSWNFEGLMRYGMHYARFSVPECYKCSTCGMLGDFKHSCNQFLVTGCDGADYDMSSAHNWYPGDGAAWDQHGWSWQKDYVDSDACSPRLHGFVDTTTLVSSAKAPKGGKSALGGKNAKGAKGPLRAKGGKAGAKGGKGKGGKGNVQAPAQEEDECDADIEVEVIAKCQAARDSLATCCRNIGGDFCDNEQDACNIDVCIDATDNYDDLENLIQSEFVDTIKTECTNVGGFGQVPAMLYEFNGDLTETMSEGDDEYTLMSAGGANVDDGALECIANGDYVYTDNLDLAHYPTTHNGFSVEVLVEVANSGTLEHLVSVRTLGSGSAQIYRNAQSDTTYNPEDFLAVDATGFTFCARHVDGSDVVDKIFLGAVYDYALSAEDVAELFREKVVEIDLDGLVTIEAIGSELKPGESMLAGQGLLSVDHRYLATLAWTGQFLIYDTVDEDTLFETGMSSGANLRFQTDGNTVIRNGFGRSVWHAGENDDAPSMLVMGTNGVLEAFNEDNEVYWNSDDHEYSRPSNAAQGVGLIEPDTLAKDIGSEWTLTLHASTETFLLYFCAVLVLANVICGTLYCYSKRSQSPYKVVAMEATGAEDTESELE